MAKTNSGNPISGENILTSKNLCLRMLQSIQVPLAHINPYGASRGPHPTQSNPTDRSIRATDPTLPQKRDEPK